MRRVTLEDLLAGAEALRDCPGPVRPLQVMRWCDQAHLADKMRKRLRRISAEHGDGSLAGRVGRGHRPAPKSLSCDAGLRALEDMIRGVRLWKQQQLRPRM